MSVETQDLPVEIDLSKLIDIGVTFRPLQLTIKDILRRLADLEKENAVQNKEIKELTENMAKLEEKNESLEKAQNELAEAFAASKTPMPAEETEGKDTVADHAALLEEVSLLNEVLGELHEDAERSRHTIDEIYAARKHRDSIARKASVALRRSSLSTTSKSATTLSVHSPRHGVSGSGVVPSTRRVTAGSLGTSQKQEDLLETSGVSLPLGDIVLSKAHEALELISDPQEFLAQELSEGSPHPGGDEEGARVSSGGARAHASWSSVSGSLSGIARPRRSVSTVDGPHGPQARRGTSASKRQSTVRSQEARTSTVLSEGKSTSSPAWAAATGGEEAGEHREAAETSTSEQQQLPHRTSRQEEKRVAESAVRGTSARGAPSPNTSSEKSLAARQKSLCNILRRDGEDIAYLNRVVAEILGEMKGLHDAVDVLRMGKDEEEEEEIEEEKEEERQVPVTTRAPADSRDLDDMRRKFARLERDLTAATKRARQSDVQREEDLSDIKKQLREMRGLTDDDANALRSIEGFGDRMRRLEERVAALEAAQGVMQEQFSNILAVGDSTGDGTVPEVNALQFAALQGTVKALEKQLAGLMVSNEDQRDWTEDIGKINDALRAVELNLESAQDRLVRLGKEANRLNVEKADRTELPEPVIHSKTEGGDAGDAAGNAGLASRLSRAEADIERLKEMKADRTALHVLRDELESLRKLMDQLGEQRDESADLDGKDLDNTGAQTDVESMLRELQGEVSALKEGDTTRLGGGLTSEDCREMLERIERLENCKADGTLVANKAERDYVENALERLMREVEQVLNATNAGLIDTLEKSLGILRDTIDGKATKQDVAKLQGWMAESNLSGGGGAGVPDGLTGFKGFRCLGCNRPMDSMRPRTLAAPMSPFLNRNPQNHPQDHVTRTIQQQQAPLRAGSGVVGGPATALGPTVSSSQALGGVDGVYQRGTNSEPLPPIEPM